MPVTKLNRRGFLRTMALSAGALGSTAREYAQPLGRACAATRPNIVFIVADDLGYEELGCQGNTDIPTPHIDSIAANGVRFTAGYATAAFCCPSRAAMMTGRYQSRYGHELNAIGLVNKQPDVGLPLTERTMADHLKAAGYATGMVGKWHLGGTDLYNPVERGFDEFFGFLHEGHFYTPPPYDGTTLRLRPTSSIRSSEPRYDLENPVLRGKEPVVEEEDYLTDAFTREAVDFIQRHRDRPFFLYLPHLAVHSPVQALNDDVDAFDHLGSTHRAIFAGMLVALDRGVGAVLQALREAGIEENTLVVFLSDNGGPTAELTSSNLPLRGGKGQLYEGGVRVPYLLQWKGKLPAGKVYEHPVSTMDVLPTALAAIGAEPLEGGGPLDGVNLLPFLLGEQDGAPHEQLYWRMGLQEAVRKGPWKLLRLPPRFGNTTQLYNVEEDIAEERDRAAELPEKVEELSKLLDAMNAQMVAPLWGTAR